MKIDVKIWLLVVGASCAAGSACGDGSLSFDHDVWLVTDIAAPDLTGAPDGELAGETSTIQPDASQPDGSDTTPTNPAIAWCRLDEPTALTLERGQTAVTSGTVWAPTLTDLTHATDENPLLKARLLIGPRDTSPGAWTTIVEATPDSTWDAEAAEAPGRDRWVADIPTTLAAGDYDYAFAFSADGGTFWTYCDRNAGLERDGSEDGYAFENAGKLQIFMDPCDPNPCPAKGPSCDGAASVTWSPDGVCSNPELVTAVCTHTELSRVNCADAGLFCTLGECRSDRHPTEGELVFTELMLNPQAVAASAGQWLELSNTTTDALVLTNLTLQSKTSTFVIDAAYTVAPGDYVVLGRSGNTVANGGAAVDLELPGDFALNSAGDVLTLRHDGAKIATLNFGSDGESPLSLAIPVGASVQLAVGPSDPTLAANWCAATVPYGSGDRGTPGGDNTRCRFEIARCRLQPLSEPALSPNRNFTVSGRFHAPGLTDVDLTRNDPHPLIRASFAVVAANTTAPPASWVWVPALPDDGWTSTLAGFEPTLDAWSRQTKSPPTPGDYRVAFRVSGDAGATWTLCDLNRGAGRDGSEDGFSLADAAALTVTNPCLPNPCTITPARYCEGDSVVSPANTGICTIADDRFRCDYRTGGFTTPCPAYCAEGACQDWRLPDRAGDLVISEYFIDATGGHDATWLELHNPTPAPLNLRGLWIDFGGDDILSIDQDIFMEAGTFLVIGANDDLALNGGVMLDLVWPELLWGTESVSLQLTYGVTLVDAVLGSASWPRGLDVSTSLNPASLDDPSPHIRNDSANNWCLATTPFGVGSFGTPGATNSSCATGVQVIRTVPAANRAEVAVDAPLIANFSVPMNAATLTAQDYFGPCVGSIQLSFDNFTTCVPFDRAAMALSAGGSTISLVPRPNLTHGLTYKWRITTGAASANGVSLAEEFSTSFQTRTPFACGGSPVVAISQVYGAGGNSGASYTHDYVELHNRTAHPVTLDGWSIRYAGATGINWTAVTNLAGVIAPGGYFLVRQAGGTVGADLPIPDQIGTMSLASSAGKAVLLTGQSTAFPQDACPTTSRIIDFVGYGTVNCAEGSQTVGAPSPSSTNATWRDVGGCVDHNMNSTDFFAGPAAPRNSASPPLICACNEDTVANDQVPAAEAEADLCAILGGNSVQVVAGATAIFEGSVLERGLTDLHDGTPPNLMAQLGYGRFGASPLSQVDWGFVPAMFVRNDSAGEDVFAASLRAPARTTATDYQAVFRVSLDDGLSWTWCDVNGAGADAGYTFELSQLPTLKVVAP